MTVSLVELNKAEVFAALFNRAKAQGFGLLQYDPTPMTAEQAEKRFPEFGYFDYVDGRVMKVDLSGDELDTGSYNRDNGPNAAEDVIASLRSEDGVCHEQLQLVSKENTQSAARDILDADDASYTNEDGDWYVVHIGTNDIIDDLRPAIDEILGEDS